ncbi:MAG: hypothetical protein JXB35_02555 [Anaerolineae bacterium]|nr:hypothetical protein [Anaerolineae bacterium]
MRGLGERRILVIDAVARRYRLRTLRPEVLNHDPREVYGILAGEALCQYLLREDSQALVMARGPLVFLSGNKLTVGYVSPLTGLPHYSFVGGRAFAELANLGLDAIVFQGADVHAPLEEPDAYLVISGCAPHLDLAWKLAAGLPSGQRAAFYWLLERELAGYRDRGSILTLGEASRWGYRAANLGVDGLYHAGRGGVGYVFARFIPALVLSGAPVTPESLLGVRVPAFRDLQNGELRDRLERYCARLSRRDGGTVTKLYTTGSDPHPTLPAHNAQRVGYALSDLGGRKVLAANRVGQTGCHWCQVNCRHWHWVPVDYAPGGRDRVLDDFEPTYALFAMLDLRPDGEDRRAKLRLLEEVDRRIVVPIEQLGIDVIDTGVALAALFEGLESGGVPCEDVPPVLRDAQLGAPETLDLAAQAITLLRQGHHAPALRALGDGPQGLARHYPDLPVFSCGPGTLGNPGHANALWTFLMPFSRFFSHYSGQIYKVPGDLRPEMTGGEISALFEDVIREMLRREQFGCLGNALSMCAFTFVIFSEDGAGVTLDAGDLLVRTLATYGIETTRSELEWFAEAFWVQSIVLKLDHGWRPPAAGDFPERVFETLALVLRRPPDDLRALFEKLIAEWRRQAGAILYKYGYDSVL